MQELSCSGWVTSQLQAKMSSQAAEAVLMQQLIVAHGAAVITAHPSAISAAVTQQDAHNLSASPASSRSIPAALMGS